jgi:RHS repeat-associated protein
MLRHDPHVVSVMEQSRHLTPRPTGTGNVTFDQYVYDGAGNVVSLVNSGLGTEQYAYDSVGRLTSATAGVANGQTYQFDAFGNRTTVTTSGGLCTGNAVCAQNGVYKPGTNHLTDDPQLTANLATYDAAGNLVVYGADEYKFDAAGMFSRSQVGVQNQQYLHTAADERIAIYDGAANWRWTLRGEDGKVLREFTSTNSGTTLGTANRQWVKDYVWRDGLLLATENRTVSGTVVKLHYHLDHLGTPRLVTNGEGAKVSTHTYHAFGVELNTAAESPETAMKFTGHERDITATSDSLDNMHARYYSALQGRFLSVDPELHLQHAMHFPQGWNRYSYVENNPLGKVDPDGRDIWDVLTGAASVYQSASAAVQPVAAGANVAALALSASPGGEGAAQVAGLLDLTARTFNLGTATGGALGNGDSYDVGMAFSSDLMTASEFTLTTATLAKGFGADSTKVVHFTNESGAAAITESGELRAGSYVTKPSQVRGINASQVESRLEIGPGKGQRSFEVRVRNDQLRVPDNGPKTSGKAWQRQTTTPCKVGECAKTPQ